MSRFVVLSDYRSRRAWGRRWSSSQRFKGADMPLNTEIAYRRPSAVNWRSVHARARTG